MPDIAYQFMIPALMFFVKLTKSYGWAIILLTVAVRILVWPLVAKSTQSMQKMAKLQPHLKAIQDRYKDNPELYQKKTAEFMAKNRINPVSGCLPLLIQTPIVIALYATFSGPPFGDKIIDVKVNAVDKTHAQEVKQAETSSQNSPYVAADGTPAKVVVFPGESTVLEGDSVTFGTRTVAGELPAGFLPEWKVISPPVKEDKPTADAGDNKGKEEPGKVSEIKSEIATIDKDGKVTFPRVGEYHVQAKIPGIAKHESFGPISELGKVSQGLAMLQPKNWDSLILVLLFGFTMFLSQKVMAVAPKPAENGQLDEQQVIQQQTAQMMPLIITGTFMFIPMPTGVLLYFVLANVIQTLQSWLIMKMPTPAFIEPADIDGGDTPTQANPNKPAGKGQTNGDKPADKPIKISGGTPNKVKAKANGKPTKVITKGGAKTMSGKGKLRKKKN
jgi:YidC/Oxa1 family membrane protein insertase